MLLGIFVGGKSKRMGGQPKGLLPAPDTGEPLVVRTARLGREAGLSPVLVGDAGAYLDTVPDLAVVHDEPREVGPLGGLNGLLQRAGQQPCIAVACDMPHLTVDILQRLGEYAGQADVFAASNPDGTRWEPMLARYNAMAIRPVLPAQMAMGVRSFQKLFTVLRLEQLTLKAGEERVLEDWDSPDDITG